MLSVVEINASHPLAESRRQPIRLGEGHERIVCSVRDEDRAGTTHSDLLRRQKQQVVSHLERKLAEHAGVCLQQLLQGGDVVLGNGQKTSCERDSSRGEPAGTSVPVADQIGNEAFPCIDTSRVCPQVMKPTRSISEASECRNETQLGINCRRTQGDGSTTTRADNAHTERIHTIETADECQRGEQIMNPFTRRHMPPRLSVAHTTAEIEPQHHVLLFDEPVRQWNKLAGLFAVVRETVCKNDSGQTGPRGAPAWAFHDRGTPVSLRKEVDDFGHSMLSSAPLIPESRPWSGP